MALQKKKTLALKVEDLLSLAGVTLKGVKVDLSGTDDGNVCVLTGKDADGDEASIKFSRLAYDHGPGDIGGASFGLLKCVDGKRIVAGLPVGGEGEQHADGRPHDHVNARIQLDRAAMNEKTPAVFVWFE